jgi:caa(3)-type oxidase subunit IV
MTTHAPAAAQAHGHAPSHGPHRHYVRIWGLLVVLLVISVIGPMAGIRVLTLITAFGIALIKAYMVAKNFMHLDVEKPIIHFMLIVGLSLMVLLYGALAPDVQKGQGQYWKKGEGFHKSFTPEKPHGQDGHAEPAGGTGAGSTGHGHP